MSEMNNNGALLEQLSRPVSEKDLQLAKFRKEGRPWLKKSREIALSLMYYLEKNGMKKKDLAEKLGVAPSYVGKLLRGKENLSLETISKIEEALGVDLIQVERPYAESVSEPCWTCSVWSYA